MNTNELENLVIERGVHFREEDYDISILDTTRVNDFNAVNNVIDTLSKIISNPHNGMCIGHAMYYYVRFIDKLIHNNEHTAGVAMSAFERCFKSLTWERGNELISEVIMLEEFTEFKNYMWKHIMGEDLPSSYDKPGRFKSADEVKAIMYMDGVSF